MCGCEYNYECESGCEYWMGVGVDVSPSSFHVSPSPTPYETQLQHLLTTHLHLLLSLQVTATWRCTTWPVNRAAISRRSSETPPSLLLEYSTLCSQDVSIRRQPSALTLLFFLLIFHSKIVSCSPVLEYLWLLMNARVISPFTMFLSRVGLAIVTQLQVPPPDSQLFSILCVGDR